MTPGRLIASHHGYFASEAAMADASVTPIVSAGEAKALPPLWVAQPELDDNVPAEIWGWMRLAFGSLWPGIITHAAADTGILLLLRLLRAPV